VWVVQRDWAVLGSSTAIGDNLGNERAGDYRGVVDHPGGYTSRRTVATLEGRGELTSRIERKIDKKKGRTCGNSRDGAK